MGGGGQVESEAFRGSVGSDTMLEAFMKKQGYDNGASTPPPIVAYSVGGLRIESAGEMLLYQGRR